MRNDKYILVRLPADLLAAVKIAAEREHESVAALVRRLIRAALEHEKRNCPQE